MVKSDKAPLLIEVGDQRPMIPSRATSPAPSTWIPTTSSGRQHGTSYLSVELEQTLLAHGITCEQTIVLYGKDRLAVARTALVLMYAGVERCALAEWRDRGVESHWV